MDWPIVLIIGGTVLLSVVIVVSGGCYALYMRTKPARSAGKAEISELKGRQTAIEVRMDDLEESVTRKANRASARLRQAQERDQATEEEEEDPQLLLEPQDAQQPQGPPRTRREVMERVRNAG